MIDTSTEIIEALRADTITTSARVDIINNKYNSGIMCEHGYYALFEGDGIKLDESQCVLGRDYISGETPTVPLKFKERIDEGWYSTKISDIDGFIMEIYSTTVYNNKENLSNLHILFTNVREEYPVRFQVAINEDWNNSITYENNTEQEIVIENVASGSKVSINIIKWNLPYAHAKILNVYLGNVLQYEDIDIANISSLKSLSLTNEETPSKDIEITIVDKDESHNIFDDNNQFSSLDNDARVIINIGVLIENTIYYVRTDEAFFKDVKKEDNPLEFIILAQGILNKYNTVDWVKLYNEIYMNKFPLANILNFNNYTDLKERIMESAELQNEALQLIRCSEKTKHIADYFTDLATACRGNLIETFDNCIWFMRVIEQSPVATINLRNMEEYPKIEKENEKYNIVANQYSYKEDDSNSEVFYGRFRVNKYNNAELTPYKTVDFLKYTMDYSDFSFVLNIYNSDGTTYASNITNNNTYDFDIVIVANVIYFILSDPTLADKTFELTLNAKTINFSSSEVKKEIYETDEEEKTIDVREIQDNTVANNVIDWIEGNISKRYKYTIKINDGFYELGDTVRLETGIYDSNNEMIFKNAIVVGIEYKYDGTFEQILTLRGA